MAELARRSTLNRRARHAFRVATAPVRARPDFLILGAQKAGTSSLFQYLAQHPLVLRSIQKEPEHFDADGRPSPLAYRRTFPLLIHFWRPGRPQPITGEATTGYLLDPRAPLRVARQLPAPGPKLVALLRDPAERAFSQYRMNLRLGRESRPFLEALEQEDEAVAPWRADPLAERHPDDAWRWRSYAARGRYAEQLERWIDVFGGERLLVLRAESLFADPAATFARVLRHLGLPPADGIEFRRVNAAPVEEEVPSEARALVERMVADDAARLPEVLARIPPDQRPEVVGEPA